MNATLAQLRANRRHLVIIMGGNLIGQWSKSGALIVRPRTDGDPHETQLSELTRLHYGGQGWGCSWTSDDLGDVLVFASGAFVVTSLNELGYQRYWKGQQIAPIQSPEDFLEALLDEQEPP